MDEMLLTMVKKTLDLHVFLNLASATIIITSFDLWMFKGGANIFALVINFLNKSWIPMHVTVGLFKVNKTSGQNMVIQPKSLLSKFGLMHYVIAFVKDKVINLTTMASVLHSIIDCEPLKFIKVYEGT
jgi:TRAP-type mannitol/chloroaromatic compound transport system permease large subunit